MICSHCKQNIPDSSCYCPNCGARQVQKIDRERPKIFRVAVCIIVLLLIIGTLVQEIREKNTENKINATTKTTSPVAEPTQTAATEAEPTERTFESQPVQPREPSPLDDDIIDVNINGCHVTYEGHEVVQNMAGDLCVAVYYQFTNNTSENQEFDLTVSDKAFQNGVELEQSVFHVNDESKLSVMEIQPGVSITVCSGFVLRDESNVELQLFPWISFDSTPSDAMLLSVK
nr:MAG TPA: protein of unknown function DUF5067 [Caudoviricetes sp.]